MATDSFGRRIGSGLRTGLHRVATHDYGADLSRAANDAAVLDQIFGVIPTQQDMRNASDAGSQARDVIGDIVSGFQDVPNAPRVTGDASVGAPLAAATPEQAQAFAPAGGAAPPPQKPANPPPSRTEPLKNMRGSRGGKLEPGSPSGLPPQMNGFSWGKGVKVDPATGRPTEPDTFHLEAPNFTGGQVHTTTPAKVEQRGPGGEVTTTYGTPRVAGTDAVAPTNVGGGGFGKFDTPESELDNILQQRDVTAGKRDLERLAVTGKPAPETAGEMLQTERAARPLAEATKRYNAGLQALTQKRAIADAAARSGRAADGAPYTKEDHAADLAALEESKNEMAQQFAIEAHGDPRLFRNY